MKNLHLIINLSCKWTILQQRTNLLDSYLIVTKSDYLRNIYYQKKLANEIISLLISDLNIDFNLGQNLAINTAQVFFSLEILLMQSLSNKCIKQVGHAKIYIPSIFNENKMISLRTHMEPLPSFANSQSYTNLSTSISLSFFDRNETEIFLIYLFINLIILISFNQMDGWTPFSSSSRLDRKQILIKLNV
ncbi:unnamed protein product [Adineta steineri]|uniref:Uncharacterized protein n=1 Tax=Adineta steineri TaxID=433720 RepID=A0A815BY26_9BILA|nr:unnamed protein product [Adineta steineri]CAF3511686.1 unnamed protein product [Adineta steineri]